MQLSFDNRGGIRRVYAIPAGDILRIRHNWEYGTVTPELRRRDGIIELPFYAGQTYNFREEHSLKDNGDCYAVSLAGIVPSHLVSTATIETLRHGEWLLLHQDTRGRIRLSGTVQIPLRFSSTSDTGSSPAELNGETFSFSATESESSPECYIADIANI